jgi:hypothetical protein
MKIDELEDIVNRILKRRAKTPIKFKDFNVKNLSKSSSVEQRVLFLLKTSQDFPSVLTNGHFQCRENAYRSVQDLWRMYKYYYDGKADIFCVMRALYVLIRSNRISGNYCGNVRKLVFWVSPFNYFSCYVEHYDTVPVMLWENIGLKS